MKNLNQSLKNLITKFINWLKKQIKPNGETFKSANNYGQYLGYALDDLKLNHNQFAGIKQPGVLRSILKVLENSTSFKNRDEKIQSDIISGFKKYIEFISVTK